MVEPLHLQDSLSKIPLLQKIHESTRAVPEAEREQFAKQFNKEVNNKNKRAQDSKETEKNVIRERQQNENEKKKKKKKKMITSEELEQETKTQMEDDDSGQLIDIMI